MNFAKNLEDASEEELRFWINNLDPKFVQLASDELSRRYSDKSSKSSNKFSRIIGAFTIIQIFLAFFQFIFEVNNSENKIFGAFLLAIISLLVFIMLEIIEKDDKKTKDKKTDFV